MGDTKVNAAGSPVTNKDIDHLLDSIRYSTGKINMIATPTMSTEWYNDYLKNVRTQFLIEKTKLGKLLYE